MPMRPGAHAWCVSSLAPGCRGQAVDVQHKRAASCTRAAALRQER
jgi:hypothetical protein